MVNRQIAVYAASSELIPEKYIKATAEIGALLAQSGWQVVYGGGGTGLMGTLADSVLEHNGWIKGIIPDFMIEVEWQHNGLTELEVVKSMYERKNKFLIGTHVVMALPGGTGTLEELLEVITLKRLGLFKGRIVILNTEGYYDPLLEMFKKCIAEKFMHPDHHRIWTVIKEPSELIEVLNNGENWNVPSMHAAKLQR